MATRDDTALVQATIDNAVRTGKPAVFGVREYWIRRTIVVPPSEGLEVSGTHLYRTRFVWKGTEGGAMFERANCRDHLWRNFTIDVQSSLVAAFIDTNKNYPVGHAEHDPSAPIPSCNRHERLLIRGNSLLANYRWYKIGQCDENNEHHSDADVRVAETHTGWLIQGQQSKYHEMTRCWFDGGAWSASAVYARGGSFSWLGGGGYGALGSFFMICEQTDTITIHRADVDGSWRFLYAAGPQGRTGSSQPISIDGGRFMTHKLAADGEAIACATAGPLTVRNFQLGSGNQPVGRIAMGGFRGALDVSGCMFGAYGSTPENSVDDAGCESGTSLIIGNTYHHPNGESYVE
jgi:hypothetical protein